MRRLPWRLPAEDQGGGLAGPASSGHSARLATTRIAVSNPSRLHKEGDCFEIRVCLAMDAVIDSVAKRALRPRAAAAYCAAAAARRTLPLGAIVWTRLSVAALVNQVVCSGEERLAPEVRGQVLMWEAQINLADLVEPLHLRVAEPKLQAGHVILELREPSRAQNRDEIVAALPDPIERHLRRRATQLLRHLLDGCRNSQRLLIHAHKGRRIAAGWLCSAAGRTALAVLARQHTAA